MNWSEAQLQAHNAKMSGAEPPPVRPNLVLAKTTDESRLNKTERAWLCELRRLGYEWIGIQAVTLKLGDDCRYTPDFIAIGPNGELIAWEVKGFMREDALVKLKTAARQFCWINFILVRRQKGAWVTTAINP